MVSRTRLQECRRAAGFKSAREFAEHIGMNVKTYTNYEQGVREMSLSVACEIVDALGCTLDDLRTGTEYAYIKLSGDSDD